VGAKDGTIRVWDVARNKALFTAKEHTNAITSLAFSLDGKMMASGSEDRTAKVWEVASGKVLATLPAHESQVDQVGLSPGGRYLVSSSYLQINIYQQSIHVVHLWDVATGKLRETFRYCWFDGFSPDGKLLALTIEGLNQSPLGRIELFDVQTLRQVETHWGTQVQTLGGNMLAFSPDGKLRAIAQRDNTVLLWDQVAGEERGRYVGDWPFSRLSFTPDGKRLVVSGWQDATVWDVPDSR
jgi:WD40 repeat protein